MTEGLSKQTIELIKSNPVTRWLSTEAPLWVNQRVACLLNPKAPVGADPVGDPKELSSATHVFVSMAFDRRNERVTKKGRVGGGEEVDDGGVEESKGGEDMGATAGGGSEGKRPATPPPPPATHIEGAGAVVVKDKGAMTEVD